MSPPFPHESGVMGGRNTTASTSSAATNPFRVPAAVAETSPASPILYSNNTFGGGSATAPAEDNSINSLKMLEETAIDDLLSLGSAGGASGNNNNHAAPNQHRHNISLTDNNTPLSPSSSSLLQGSHHSNDDDFFWRLTNPVHMELQENAKLPTFNWAVDRTGSVVDPGGWQNPHFRSLFSNNSNNVVNASKTTCNKNDKMTTTAASSSTDDDDINWGELFLQSNRRASYHASFQYAGALQNEGRGGFMSSNSNSSSRRHSAASETDGNKVQTKDNDALAEALASVDPTPLSEIRRRVMEHQHQQEQQQQTTPTSNRAYPGPGHPARARPIPLPVPGEAPKPSSSVAAPAGSGRSSAIVRDTSLAEAVATAAAIASQQQQQQNTAAKTNTASTGRTVPAAISRNNGRSWNTSASIGQSKYNAPQHATKHIATQETSQRRAHYGFGVKHVVPSVPAPPSSSKQQQLQSHMMSPKRPGIQHQLQQQPPAIPAAVTMTRSTSQRSSSPTRPTLSMRMGPPPTSSSSTTGVPGSTNNNNNDNNGSSTAAYERKKQRAKDARIRLNESIDRLSIAVNLAGSQSKLRAQQWKDLTDMLHHQSAGTQVMKDCVRAADGAKKWDRPTFVGTAATLIQNLNAQCDIFMRELLELREKNKATSSGAAAAAAACTTRDNTNANGGDTNAAMANGQTSASNETPSTMLSAGFVVPSTTHVKREGTPIDDVMYHKRPRVETGDWTTAIVAPSSLSSSSGNLKPVLQHVKILECVASFLDPQSLVRCHGLCKIWKSSGAFANESVWETFVLRRFGFYNMRQWRGRMDDDDAGVSTPSIVLYKNMDAANVMPHFPIDGMLLLGEARLSGKVSAWTFMVERSNGETLRSVRREGSMQGNGAFASLPVVELRTVVQNTGVSGQPLILRRQTQTVDASTRRRGDEMVEIGWDERFQKRILNLDGSHRPALNVPGLNGRESLCHLEPFDVIVIVTYIYAKGCSTTSKFIQRSNFTKILVQVNNGTTVPLVIPFPRDAVSLHH